VTWYTFGGRPDAVLTDTAGNVVPNWPLTVKVAGTGAVVTALFEANHTTPIAQLRSNAAGTFPPGAIRTFAIEDVRAITYLYLDASSNPVTWYEEAREVGTSALDASVTATAAAADAAAAAAAAQATADAALASSGLESWYSATAYGAVGNGTADDVLAIQAALDDAAAAGGGTVVLAAGKTFAVSTFLVALDHVTIYAYGATVRSRANSGLLRNFTDTELFNGYAGHSHITVLGGVWDGNAFDGTHGTVTSETDVMNFVHGTDITVRDARILNTSTAHALEFNSVDGGRAINCRFEGFQDNSSGSVRQFSEAVQIDIAKSGSASIGNFDNAASKNIVVQGCYFGPSDRCGVFGRAVGSHTIASATYYDSIQILGNRIDGTIQEGIHGYGWRHVVIADNIITATGLDGINLTVPDPASAGYALTAHSMAIKGNTVDSPTTGPGIRVLGFLTAKMGAVSITGNTVKNAGSVGLHAEQCTAPIIAGNTVETTTTTGIYGHVSDDATVTGNTVRNAGSNAINLSGCRGGTVAGNTVDTTGSNFGVFAGLAADGTTASQDLVITGNKISKAFGAGIRLSTSTTGCLVAGNQVRKDGGSTSNGITLAASATGAVVLDNDFSGNSWSAATAMLVSTANPITGMGGMTALPGSNLCDADLTALTPLEAALRPPGRFETTSRLRCGTTSTPASGTLYLVPIWLPAGFPVAHLAFVSANAATSPTHWWFTLHDANRVALARTADQTTTAWAGSTQKSLAIAQATAGTATSYTTTYTGLHHIGFCYTGSALTLMSEGTLSQQGDVAPAYGASSTGQTTPPTVTGGAFTAAAPSGAAISAYAFAS
jgi:putative cofactor-binding repeat protein